MLLSMYGSTESGETRSFSASSWRAPNRLSNPYFFDCLAEDELKTTLKMLTLLALLSMSLMLHATSVSVGSMDGGNCYPFMCNDSGTSVGVSIDYQQAFVSSAFSGPFTVSSISWSYWPFAGPAIALGGNYTFSWGYSAVGLGLSTNLASNYNGAPNLIGTASIPAGGINFGTTLTLTSGTPFTYNPALGDLILEVVVDTQDNVPNTGANGYNWADYTGAVTTRAYCLTNVGCSAGVGALDTTFTGQSSATPEPGSLMLLGSGIVGLAGFARRKFKV